MKEDSLIAAPAKLLVQLRQNDSPPLLDLQIDLNSPDHIESA